MINLRYSYLYGLTCDLEYLNVAVWSIRSCKMFRVQCLLITLMTSSLIKCDYWSERQELLMKEAERLRGHSTYKLPRHLGSQRLKKEELMQGHLNDSNFLPGQNFLLSKKGIVKSELYSLIRKMPKGASLHTHLTAAVSFDFLFNLTYKDNLYGCHLGDVYKLRFFRSDLVNNVCEWKSLKEIRKTDNSFDAFLRHQVALDEEDAKRSVGDLQNRMKKAFSTRYHLLSYRPVFEEYVYQALLELYRDKVMYAEFRAITQELYELDETMHGSVKFVEIFRNIVDIFKRNHPNFWGAKLIYSPFRNVSNEALDTHMATFISIKRKFPEVVAGLDLVGYEDDSKPLYEFVRTLQYGTPDVKLFLHAGETKWYGHTELNLVDAVLLNATRIGHGISVVKHPEVKQLIKNRRIAIEVCPISNQVLGFVSDPRNHPMVGLVAEGGYDLVIGSDDPGMWGATGLSFDWYYFFMAMTGEDAEIDVLYELALNSIKHSAISEVDKEAYSRKLYDQWNDFIKMDVQTNKLSN